MSARCGGRLAVQGGVAAFAGVAVGRRRCAFVSVLFGGQGVRGFVGRVVAGSVRRRCRASFRVRVGGLGSCSGVGGLGPFIH